MIGRKALRVPLLLQLPLEVSVKAKHIMKRDRQTDRDWYAAASILTRRIEFEVKIKILV